MFKFFTSGAFVFLVSLLVGCGTSAVPMANDTSIVIGGIGPLTGDASSYGLDFQRSAELALEDVNSAWAVKGMSLDIQWEDGQCNGAGGSTAAQKLVGVDKAQVLLTFCSPEVLAAAPITEPARVVVFSPGASSPAVTYAGDYVFRNWPSDSFQGELLAKLAYEQGYRTMAVITEQQDYTFGISNVFTKVFTDLGGTVIEETYLPDDTDFKTQLIKLKGSGFDAMFINPQTPVKAEVILKQMGELGMSAPLFLNDAAGTNLALIQDYAGLLEGAYTATVQVDPKNDAVSRFVDRYAFAYGTDLNYLAYSVSTYDSVWIVAQALEAVGNDGRAIQAYLNDFPGYDGLMGNTRFDDNGDPVLGHSVFVIKNGALVLR